MTEQWDLHNTATIKKELDDVSNERVEACIIVKNEPSHVYDADTTTENDSDMWRSCAAKRRERRACLTGAGTDKTTPAAGTLCGSSEPADADNRNTLATVHSGPSGLTDTGGRSKPDAGREGVDSGREVPNWEPNLRQQTNTHVKGYQRPSPVQHQQNASSMGKRARRKAAKRARLDGTSSLRDDSKCPKTEAPRPGYLGRADILSELFVAITTEPAIALTEAQADLLKKGLHERIFEAVLSVPENNATTVFAPAFRGKPLLSEGVLKMGCEDDQSLQWLKATVAKMPQISEGISLKVILQSEIVKQVKAGLLLPTAHTEIPKIHRVLCAQNPWYDIRTWTLISASIQEKKGLFLTLNIPKVEVEKITKRSRRVAFGMGSVYVRYFTAHGLSDTPPGTKTTTSAEIATTSTSGAGAPAASAAARDNRMGSEVKTEVKDGILGSPSH